MGMQMGGRNNRRRFFKQGAMAAGTAALGTLLARGGMPVFAADDEDRRPLTRGDIAILRFLAAAEEIESDLWLQYTELGGVQDSELPATSGNALYTNALTILDGDMPQYIHDNTDDEFSHVRFLNNYLAAKGAEPVDLSRFANIPGSTATGSSGKPRLTNLTKLTIDTSFWSRYRSITNPDFDRNAQFVQAVPSLSVGQHTAIPRSDDDVAGSSVSDDPATSISTHLQAIAFTAGFHFAFIEQGGTSLYATMAQKVSSLEVLRIVLSIGGSEIMHFQTWQDKAGNATPLTFTDPVNKSTVTFVDLTTNQPQTLQANLIMPEPCDFLQKSFGPVSIIRPTTRRNSGARAAI